MWQQAAGQIEAIHSMMESGHRSVSLERHTLYLWGGAVAFLIVFVRHVFTPELFPVIWQRTVVSNVVIILVLTTVGVWDWRLTRRAREMRDESLSFIQTQMIKVWWGIVAIIVMINIGMNFFGGGYLFYPIMVSMVGLAFFVHGLFSQQLLSWVGLLMVILGLCSMALRLSLMTMEWMTVAIFGIGFPVLAWLLNWRPPHVRKHYRVVFSILWLSVIAVPTYAMVQLDQKYIAPTSVVTTLQQYQTQVVSAADVHIIRLPAGTVIPMQVKVHSPVLATESAGSLSLQLSQPLDIVLENGKPNGQYRVDNGAWNTPRHKFTIQNVQFNSSLTPSEGPQVIISMDLETAH